MGVPALRIILELSAFRDSLKLILVPVSRIVLVLSAFRASSKLIPGVVIAFYG